MAITIPDNCYRQPAETEGVNEHGEKVFSYILKGPYGRLEGLLHTLSGGMEIVAGWVMQSARLARSSGAGVLTIDCVADAGESGEGAEKVQKSLSETWTLKAVRNDKSIMAYCGSKSGCPNRALVEAWQKEPDGDLAKRYAFARSDGTVIELVNLQGEEGTRDLIAKIMDGVDSVMRFYPMLTKTSVYSRPPQKVYENLSYIDTPSIGNNANTLRLTKPGNLAQIIANHTWVKCQDDYQQTADGKHSRIESWLGSDDKVDEDLYGVNRWPMPYNHAKNATH